MNNLLGEIKKLERDIIHLRRVFHQMPETGFEEFETAKCIAGYLDDWGYEVKTGIGKTGIVAVMRGKGSKQTVAVRADMDALPINEETGLDFASNNKGRMHACGHDSHIAIALGTAKVIAGFKDRLRGNVKFIFQPAEELLEGARAMLEDDNPLKNPDVDTIIGLHNWPELEKGLIGLKKGPIMSAADYFEITINGKGGHGAIPEQAIDPLIMASQLILALQNIVSREISPTDVAVISIGSFECNSTANIIPEQVILKGTVRTIDTKIREFIKKRIKEVTAGVTLAGKGKYQFDYHFKVPPTINNNDFTDLVEKILKEKMGGEKIVNIDKPSMVSEDFAFFLQQIPGTYFLLGMGKTEKIGLHNSQYSVDEDVLITGVQAFCEIIFNYVF